jgi:hypothetical protein
MFLAKRSQIGVPKRLKEIADEFIKKLIWPAPFGLHCFVFSFNCTFITLAGRMAIKNHSFSWIVSDFNGLLLLPA